MSRKHVDIAYEEEEGAKAGGGGAEGRGEVAVGAVRFEDWAVLPTEEDNCAIAKSALSAGSELKMSDGSLLVLGHTVLEGHRCVAGREGRGRGVGGVGRGGGERGRRGGGCAGSW
jgi:hypothetical protein